MGSAVVESIIIMKHFLVLSCLVVLIMNQSPTSAAILGVGGLGDVLDANPEMQYVIDQVRSEVDDCPDFKAINFRAQFVAGINYYVKVQLMVTTMFISEFIQISLEMYPSKEFRPISRLQMKLPFFKISCMIICCHFFSIS